MITKKNKEEAKKLILGAKKIGLVSHIYGDPDSFGSVLGMQEVLKELGKEVVIFSEEELIPLIKDYEEEVDFAPKNVWEEVSLLLILDLAGLERIAAPKIASKITKEKTLYIDHHASDVRQVGTADLVDPKMASTSEICFDFTKEMNLPLTEKAVKYFYLGLCGDTGCFTFYNTTDRVLAVAKEMIKINPTTELEAKTAFENDRKKKEVLVKKIAKRAVKSNKYPLMVSYIKLSDLDGKSVPEISSQVANYLEQNTEGVGAAVMLEVPGEITKISMRSNKVDFNVRELAEQFGGGGHDKAAGIITTKSMAEMAEALGAEFVENFADLST